LFREDRWGFPSGAKIINEDLEAGNRKIPFKGVQAFQCGCGINEMIGTLT
jgi:hypothetical protein